MLQLHRLARIVAAALGRSGMTLTTLGNCHDRYRIL
jgi:hypothetical protein